MPFFYIHAVRFDRKYHCKSLIYFNYIFFPMRKLLSQNPSDESHSTFGDERTVGKNIMFVAL